MTKFRTGKGINEQRDIDIGTIYEKLRQKICGAIIGFHAFTGCDHIGRFNTESKTSCWDVFKVATPEILDALKSLGCCESLLTLATLGSIEKFVVALYGSSDSASESLADLR